MGSLTLTYSLADQNFNQTKSVGIFNVSTQLLENLSGCGRIAGLNVLSNSTLEGRLRLPPGVVIQYHNEAIGGSLGRIIWDQLGVYKAAKDIGNEWLFLPKGFASFLKPPTCKLAVYVYDAMHAFYGANYPGVMPWFESKYFMKSLRGAFRYADVIFTDSNFAKDELRHLAHSLRLKPPIIKTVGIGFTRSNEMVSKERDSLLFLTSVWPHKLTETGIDFIKRWQRQTGFSGRVELIGSLPSGIRLPRLAGWRYHPRLSEEVYRQFLAEAKAFLFFSAYEGFGMPPVEAMIAGACPVFSDLPVTREVMAGRGFSFSNNSYVSFSQAIDKALRVSEAQIRLWSEELLKFHNWDKVVKETVDGLTEADNV